VLAPTRELAQQTHVEALRFGKGVRSVCIYGGIPMHDSVNSLRGAATPQLIVATPRRLIDLCKYRKISLGKVTMLVLDEADRMLDMGFKPQLEAIIQSMSTPAPRFHTVAPHVHPSPPHGNLLRRRC
jgi:superfamily II DNA/RNA helicase